MIQLKPFPLNIQNYINEKHNKNTYNWIHIHDNNKIPDSIMVLVTNKNEIDSIIQLLACL